MRYSIPLQANIPTRQLIRGKCIVILSTGAAPGVDLALLRTEQNEDAFGTVSKNFSVYDNDGGGFVGMILTATVNATIEVIVTNYDARTRDGDSVTATLDAAQLPLPVQNQQGDAPANPLFVSGVVLGDTPATNVTDAAAVAAGPVATQVLAADATRLEAVFYNIGPDPVALGMLGITWAKRAIVLNAGDAWIEARGATKAWYAITDAAKAGSVTVQERKA